MAAADRLVATHDRHGYGRGLGAYYWGCNGGVARTFLNLSLAHRLTNDARYIGRRPSTSSPTCTVAIPTAAPS